MVACLARHTGGVHLTKHHGLGNDFLITVVNDVPAEAALRAQQLCDRSTGVGADGLIYGIDQGSVVTMRLFNSDGSEAEISGNGARCFLQAIAMRRGVNHLEIDLDTLAGIRQGSLEPTKNPLVAYASVDMGEVSTGDQPANDHFPAGITGLGPVNDWTTAAVGNPHVIFNLANPENIDLALVGPQIEAQFAHGVNAHMVSVRTTDELDLYVWERGAGITQACGSGATVSAQRFHDWGLVGQRVTVHMPGGSAVVDVMTSDRPTAILSGETTFVASLEVPHG